MTSLHIDGTDVSDLSPVSGMTDLSWLAAQSTNIIDVTPLAGMCWLDNVFLLGNGISCPDPTVTALRNCGVNINVCP